MHCYYFFFFIEVQNEVELLTTATIFFNWGFYNTTAELPVSKSQNQSIIQKFDKIDQFIGPNKNAKWIKHLPIQYLYWWWDFSAIIYDDRVGVKELNNVMEKILTYIQVQYKH